MHAIHALVIFCLPQELFMPAVASGTTAVLAAETGSGKTLSYLAPVSSLLLEHKEDDSLSEEMDPRQGINAFALKRSLFSIAFPFPLTPHSSSTTQRRRAHALILCPNVSLCQQVLAVALSLKSTNGSPLLSACLVNSSNPPPAEAPDIIVATPGGLLNFISEAGVAYGHLWTPEGLTERVKHVVLDEADMLLGTGMDRQTMRLMQLFRTDDRRRVEAKVFSELGITKADLDRLPRPMVQACWKGERGAVQCRWGINAITCLFVLCDRWVTRADGSGLPSAGRLAEA